MFTFLRPAWPFKQSLGPICPNRFPPLLSDLLPPTVLRDLTARARSSAVAASYETTNKPVTVAANTRVDFVLQRICTATRVDARLFIDGGDPLREIPIPRPLPGGQNSAPLCRP